jgi:glycerol-3-phosphate dehydrogenase subunit B
MSDSKTLSFDVCVIGSGMAGTAAALFAANRGLTVAQVGQSAEIIFASGLLDLMAVHPVEAKRVWHDPWACIDALIKDLPRHPYARLKKADIRAAMDEFLEFLAYAGVHYQRQSELNAEVITALGTTKITYAVPETMWSGVDALKQKTPCLVADVRGLKGFNAIQIVETLRARWPALRVAQIEFPGTKAPGDVYAEPMARALEVAGTRSEFARRVKVHLADAAAVAVPAILGISWSREVHRDLQGRLGVPVFEIPTMPPSIAGLRLKEAFAQSLPAKGVRVFAEQRVLAVARPAKGDFRLDVGGLATEHVLRAKAVILASGRFIGQGLRADRKRVRETIFDLPVYQPQDRSQWHHRQFLDSRGHPIHRAGLEIDRHLRPLGKGGRPAHLRLFAAGSILAHQDWIRMKCGSGLAIATAYGAVKGTIRLL